MSADSDSRVVGRVPFTDGPGAAEEGRSDLVGQPEIRRDELLDGGDGKAVAGHVNAPGQDELHSTRIRFSSLPSDPACRT